MFRIEYVNCCPISGREVISIHILKAIFVSKAHSGSLRAPAIEWNFSTPFEIRKNYAIQAEPDKQRTNDDCLANNSRLTTAYRSQIHNRDK